MGDMAAAGQSVLEVAVNSAETHRFELETTLVRRWRRRLWPGK
jgi:hypothetical protein